MKKFLLSVLCLSTLSTFSQWSQTSEFLGEDVIPAFGNLFSANVSTSGLDMSTNDGTTWTASNTGLSTGVRFGTLYGGVLYVYKDNNIYQSTTGNNWTLMTSAISALDKVTSMTSISGTVMASTNPQSGSGSKIYQLNGASWVLRSTITTTLITVLRNLNGTIWAGTAADKVLKSTDMGLTFANSSAGLGSPAWWDKYINCLAATPSAIYAGTHGGRIFKSVNNATWTPVYYIGNGLSTVDISDMYNYNGNLLIACDSGFVYTKDDFATTPVQDNSGLTGQQHQNLQKICVTTNSIIGATRGLGVTGGVFHRSLTQIFSGIKENSLPLIESTVYPNPATQFAIIEAGDLVNENNCEVKLTDILGREAAVFEMKNGKANLNLSSFSKGIYTYSVYKNKSQVSKGKLIVN